MKKKKKVQKNKVPLCRGEKKNVLICKTNFPYFNSNSIDGKGKSTILLWKDQS